MSRFDALLNDPEYLNMNKRERLAVWDGIFHKTVAADPEYDTLSTDEKTEAYTKFIGHYIKDKPETKDAGADNKSPVPSIVRSDYNQAMGDHLKAALDPLAPQNWKYAGLDKPELDSLYSQESQEKRKAARERKTISPLTKKENAPDPNIMAALGSSSGMQAADQVAANDSRLRQEVLVAERNERIEKHQLTMQANYDYTQRKIQDQSQELQELLERDELTSDEESRIRFLQDRIPFDRSLLPYYETGMNQRTREAYTKANRILKESPALTYPIALGMGALGLVTSPYAMISPDGGLSDMLAGFNSGLNSEGSLAGNITRGILYSAPMTIAMVLQPHIGAVLTQTMITSDNIRDMYQDGQLEQTEAIAASLSGAIQSIIEYGITQSQIKAIRSAYKSGGAPAAEALVKESIQEIMKPTARQIGKSLLKTGVEESFEEVAQNVADKLVRGTILGDPLPNPTEWAMELAIDALGGFFGGLAFGGIGTPINIKLNNNTINAINEKKASSPSTAFLADAIDNINTGDFEAARKNYRKAQAISGIDRIPRQSREIQRGFALVNDALNLYEAKAQIEQEIAKQKEEGIEFAEVIETSKELVSESDKGIVPESDEAMEPGTDRDTVAMVETEKQDQKLIIDESKNLDEQAVQLEKAANDSLDAITKIVEVIKRIAPKTETDHRVKSAKGIIDKVNRPDKFKKGYKVSDVGDAIAFRTVVNDLQEIEAIIPELVEYFEKNGIEILDTDFERMLSDDPFKAIYFDLVLPNGVKSEYQIIPKELREAQKNGGHEMYEWLRNRERPSSISPERFEFDEKVLEMRRLYHSAFRSFFQRSQASQFSEGTTPDFNKSITKLSALVPDKVRHSERGSKRVAESQSSASSPGVQGSDGDLRSQSPKGSSTIVRGVPGSEYTRARDKNSGVARETKSDIGTSNRNIAQDYDNTEFSQGKVVKNYLPGDKRLAEIDVVYEIVDAASIEASHDEDFSINDNYPKDLQPRESRGSDSMRMQTDNRAKNLNPDLYGEAPTPQQGAPLIGSDNYVDAGNGRVMALKRMWKYYPETAQKYRDWLREQTEKLGLDPKSIDGMDSPVLIKRRVTDLSQDDRVYLTKASNNETTDRYTPVEQAISDSEALGLIDINLDFNSDGTVDWNSDPDFIKEFLTKVIPEAEWNSLAPGNNPSAALITRIVNSMVVRAYGNNKHAAFLVNTINDSSAPVAKNIINALVLSAPLITQARQQIEQGYLYELDMSDNLIRAAARYVRAVVNQEPIDVLIDQTEILVDDELNDFDRMILSRLYKYRNSPKQIIDEVKRFYDFVYEFGNPSQASLFGDTPVSEVTDLYRIVTLSKDIDEYNSQLVSIYKDEQRHLNKLDDIALTNAETKKLENKLAEIRSKLGEIQSAIESANTELKAIRSRQSFIREEQVLNLWKEASNEDISRAIIGMLPKKAIKTIDQSDPDRIMIDFEDGRMVQINVRDNLIDVTWQGESRKAAGQMVPSRSASGKLSAVLDIVRTYNKGNLTAYHEGFHMAYMMFLNAEQKQYLDNYYHNMLMKPGEYTEAQRNDPVFLEEYMADAFADYAVNVSQAKDNMITRMWNELLKRLHNLLDKIGLLPDGIKAKDMFGNILAGRYDAGTETGVNRLYKLVPEVSSEPSAYQLRSGPVPSKTMIAYKAFIEKDGKLYPLFVSAKDALPMDTWLDATEGGYHFTGENGREYVPADTGVSMVIPNEEVRKELYNRGHISSIATKKVKVVAYRPGWHGGTMPIFPQGGIKADKYDLEGYPYLHVHPDNLVFAEVEFDGDRDYKDVYESTAERNKDGSINKQKSGLRNIPKGGYYEYATNTELQGRDDLGNWLISGSMKINQILSKDEVNGILGKESIPAQLWDHEAKNKQSLEWRLARVTPMPKKPDITKIVFAKPEGRDWNKYHKDLDKWEKQLADWADNAPDVLPFSGERGTYGRNLFLVSRDSTKDSKNRPWRLTYFHENQNGEIIPSGHSLHASKVEAIKELGGNKIHEKFDPGIRFKLWPSDRDYSIAHEVSVEERLTSDGTRFRLATAYHGSGKLFNRFDVQYIGTGEGAQAFGWGLYVSENRNVAKDYADRMKQSNLHGVVTVGDFPIVMESHSLYDDTNRLLETILKDYRERYTPETKNIGAMEFAISSYMRKLAFALLELKTSNDKDVAAGIFNSLSDDYDYSIETANTRKTREWNKDALNALKEFYDNYILGSDISHKPFEHNQSIVYTVSVWEQHQEDVLDWQGVITDDQRKKISDQFKKEFDSDVDFGHDHTGKQLYNDIPIALQFYGGRDYRSAGQKDASLFLLRAGIDGIKYPVNAMTGGTGDKGFNFVVFDDSQITIINNTRYRLIDSKLDELITRYDAALDKVRSLRGDPKALAKDIAETKGLDEKIAKDKFGRIFKSAGREAGTHLTETLQAIGVTTVDRWLETNKPYDQDDMTFHLDQAEEFANQMGLSKEDYSILGADGYTYYIQSLNVFSHVNYLSETVFELQKKVTNINDIKDTDEQQALLTAYNVALDQLETAWIKYSKMKSNAGRLLRHAREKKTSQLRNMAEGALSVGKIDRYQIEELNRISNEILSKENQLSSMELNPEAVTNLKSEIQDLILQKAELESTLADMQAKIDHAGGVMEGLKDEFMDLRTQINSLNKTLKSKKDKLAEYENFVPAAAEKINALKKEIAQLKKDKQSILDEIAKLNDKLEDAKLKIRNAENPKDIVKMLEPSIWDIGKTIYYAHMLSGPVTHLKNIVSTAMNMTVDQFVLDLLQPGNILESRRQMKHSLSKAVGAAKESWAYANTNKYDHNPIEITENKLIKMYSHVFKALAAEDAFLTEISRASRMSSIAYELAKGDRDKYNALMAEPSSEMLLQVQIESKRSAFNNNPEGLFVGSLYGAIENVRKTVERYSPAGGMAIRAILPFIRVPANVFQSAINWTPFGYIHAMGWKHFPTLISKQQANIYFTNEKKGISLGGWARKVKKTETDPKTGKTISETTVDENNPFAQREAAMQLAKATIGTILVSILLAIGKGIVSGGGPRDPDKRDQLRKTGWLEYSVKIGDKWYSYRDWFPFALTLAIVGNYHDYIEYHGKEDERLEDRMGFALMGVSRMIMDRSFLDGLSQLISAMDSQDGKYLGRLTTRTVGTFLSPNIFKQIENLIYGRDLYKPETVAEQLIIQTKPYTRMTSMLNKVPKRIDVFGEDQSLPGGVWYAFGVPKNEETKYMVGGKNLVEIIKKNTERGVYLPVPKSATLKTKGNSYKLKGKDLEMFKRFHGKHLSMMLSDRYEGVMQRINDSDDDTLHEYYLKLSRRARTRALKDIKQLGLQENY